MVDDKKIDVSLLKSMMMGDYAGGFSNKDSSKNKSSKKGTKNNNIIDLHANKIGIREKHESILEQQIRLFISFIEIGKKKQFKKIIAIHGKGNGTLKKAIIEELKKQNLKYSTVIEPPYFGNALKISLK